MSTDLKTANPLRDTMRAGPRDASAVKVCDVAWLESEKQDPDRDEVDQAADKAVVDAFTIPWKSEVRAVPSMQARAEMAPALVVIVLLVAYLRLAFGKI